MMKDFSHFFFAAAAAASFAAFAFASASAYAAISTGPTMFGPPSIIF